MQNAMPFAIFDDEFKTYTKGAKLLVEKLIGQEKNIAVSWMKRLMNLQSTDITVKKDRNHFMKKLLIVMKQSVWKRILDLPKGKELSRQDKEKIKDELTNITETLTTPTLDKFFEEEKLSSTFMSLWSSDRRTYMAVKPIPGRGALVYMAVSERPDLGWSIPSRDFDYE